MQVISPWRYSSGLHVHVTVVLWMHGALSIHPPLYMIKAYAQHHYPIHFMLVAAPLLVAQC